MRTIAYTTICVGLACALNTSSFADAPQKLDPTVSPARAAAIHECALAAAKYLDYVWGNVEMYIYRSCMAAHSQRE